MKVIYKHWRTFDIIYSLEQTDAVLGRQAIELQIRRYISCEAAVSYIN